MTDYTLGLTAVNIDAVLQGVNDGSLIPAINKIKTSQFVVEGTTGDPLPSTTPTDYLVGAEIAFGWVVTTDVVDAVIDSNGNPNATSGVVEYTFNKADNGTPNAASLFASVMRCTDAANNVYVQDYADGSNGISITETTATVTMVIDFSSFAGGKVFGVSEQLGRLPIDSTKNISIDSARLSTANLYHLQDQKATGVDGGGFAAGDWYVRTLNTEVTANIDDASLSSNQITLPKGRYFIEASCPGYEVQEHAIRLQDITNAVTLSSGQQNRTGIASGVQNFSYLCSEINISDTTVIELQHRCTQSRSTAGFGTSSGFASIEIYADIKIWKVE